MSIRIRRPLPSEEEISALYPIGPQHNVERNRQQIRDILSGLDHRLLAIVGPCSAYPFDSVKKYADKLVRLSERVSEQILVVMRCYIQKPRTIKGWAGPMVHPDPLSGPDIVRGVHLCREMDCYAAQLHPLMDEILFTHNAKYFAPLMSDLALGARSAEDMEHRYVASGLDAPVGVKNPTSGDIEIGVNGVECVQSPHIFTYQNAEVETSGNNHAHLILRGGTKRTNYEAQSILEAHNLLSSRNVKNPAIIVDASHDNSRIDGGEKDEMRQLLVVRSVLEGILEEREGYQSVCGFSMESFLKAGKQKIALGMDPEVSITDACVSFDDTERAIQDNAFALSRRRN